MNASNQVSELSLLAQTGGFCELSVRKGLKHQCRPNGLRSFREPTLEQVADESAQIVAQNQ